MRDVTNWNRPSGVPPQGSRTGSEITSFQSEMNRLLDRFFGEPGAQSLSAAAFPAIDVLEAIRHFEVRIELPGLDPKDVEASVSEGFLTIRGTRMEKKEEKDRNYLRSEISRGEFQRTIALPETADTEGSFDSSFENGVLTLIIPKKEEAPRRTKKIAINRAKPKQQGKKGEQAMQSTKVKDIMKKNPVLAAPGDTLMQAAEKMKSIGCGVLPVGTADNLQGMITDRDIVIRAVAQGKDPSKEKVADYMTEQTHACKEDDTLQEVAEKMREHEVSRLIVQDDAGKMTGIITFGAILRKNQDEGEVSNVVQSAVRKEAA